MQRSCRTHTIAEVIRQGTRNVLLCKMRLSLHVKTAIPAAAAWLAEQHAVGTC